MTSVMRPGLESGWELGLESGRGRNRVGVRTSTFILFLYNTHNTADSQVNSNPHYKPNINITTNS